MDFKSSYLQKSKTFPLRKKLHIFNEIYYRSTPRVFFQAYKNNSLCAIRADGKYEAQLPFLHQIKLSQIDYKG
jgi:hypothetical protein